MENKKNYPYSKLEQSSLTSTQKFIKPKSDVDYNKLFLIISFIGLVIEAASSAFNLASVHLPVSERMKCIAILVFYISCTIVTVAMIISSALAIQESISKKKLYKNLPETPDKKTASSTLIKHNQLMVTQANLQISENSLTIISHIMWVIVSIASLIMLSIGGSPVLEQLSLLLSVTAPFLGVVSCILRLLDANISRKTSNSEREKRQSCSFTILFAVILAFEAIHCICHIMEAISLNGKMHNLYNFQDNAILCLELITVLAFIMAFFIEKYLDNKAEQSQASGNNHPHPSTLDSACAELSAGEKGCCLHSTN